VLFITTRFKRKWEEQLAQTDAKGLTSRKEQAQGVIRSNFECCSCNLFTIISTRYPELLWDSAAVMVRLGGGRRLHLGIPDFNDIGPSLRLGNSLYNVTQNPSHSASSQRTSAMWRQSTQVTFSLLSPSIYPEVPVVTLLRSCSLIVFGLQAHAPFTVDPYEMHAS